MSPSTSRRHSDEEAHMLESDEEDDYNFSFHMRPPGKGKDKPQLDEFDTIVDPKHLSRRRFFFNLRIFRWLLYIPIALLACFGLLHLIRTHLTGDGLFFDPSPPSDFLPDWESPIAHYPTDATRDIVPIPVHSHNDYWRRIPLFEALHYGATGVEADVWLKHEELYVGHSTASLTQNRTLRAMYLDPLMEMLGKMNPDTDFGTTTGNGVFDTDHSQTLVLMIDFKTDGNETWPAVVAQLRPLREAGYLSYWNGSATIYRAITVVATGNAPWEMVVKDQTYRDVFFDAPLADLGGEAYDTSNSYYASTNMEESMGWPSKGKFSDRQLQEIRAQIKKAKEKGLVARYWGTPAWPIGRRNMVWQTLVEEGVGMLNVDDLRSAARMNWRKKAHGLTGR